MEYDQRYICDQRAECTSHQDESVQCLDSLSPKFLSSSLHH